jgi:predicted transglutaminase-like cysteine proteinase
MDRTLLAVAAIALGLVAQPATAQTTPLFGASKAEAILGGPSKLAALIAQQSGEAQSIIAAAPQPSSRGRAVFAEPVLFRPTLSRDRPDVFGSVALHVQHTPLDRRWRRVQNARVGGSLASWAHGLSSLPVDRRAEAVNRYVNARVAFTDDLRQYHRADVWQSASDTLRRRRGDCEDYAIAKLQLLRAAGVAPSDLYLVIVKDLVRRADHAVLVVRIGEQMLLLDNATDRVTDATAYQDYRPVLSYAAAGRAWTHGYQRAPASTSATVSVASASLATAALR